MRHFCTLDWPVFSFQKLCADKNASSIAVDRVEKIILCPQKLHCNSSVLKWKNQISSLPLYFHHASISAHQLPFIMYTEVVHLSDIAGCNLSLTFLPICPNPSYPNSLANLFLVVIDNTHFFLLQMCFCQSSGKTIKFNDKSTCPMIFKETWFPPPTLILSTLVMS